MSAGIYRSKTILVEAVQMVSGTDIRAVPWFMEAVAEGRIKVGRWEVGVSTLSVESPFGWVEAKEGDWIVNDDKSNLIVMPRALFAETFEDFKPA